ncbi:hypothetical protein PFICI_09090 [Pestalotiopsis fici W106-1]|uniref:Uncharacterized protein n=1 Tax=Pestalotiopsis fici (strain W106-1 / CGMCC3.15140) TaxID=1229662 RepID=W3X1J8_PESFW|nr:uncharacterized protein PFICI_09090 [Pestalotiopsis fici W106-1]ETS79237.1 hypothetical protein PFICI_09090 [Pestalotiopsis fici W106-1]
MGPPALRRNVLRRSTAIRHRAKSLGPAVKREASQPPSDGVVRKSTKIRKTQEAVSQQPEQEDAGPEAAAILAKYNRLHKDQTLSGLPRDWASLNMLIRGRPDIKKSDAERGVNIIQRLVAEPTGGSCEGTYKDLEKLLRSLPGEKTPEAEIEAALILARRMEAHFNIVPSQIVKTPPSPASTKPPTPKAADPTSKPAKTATSKPAETFEEMGVPASEDTEDRGRVSRRDNFNNFNRAASRAASRVRDKVRRSLSRSRPPTSRASSPQDNREEVTRGRAESPPVRSRGRTARARRSRSVHGDPATRTSGSTRQS